MRNLRAFTLIELLVVLAILALLITIGTSQFGKFMNTGDITATETTILGLKQKLETYRTTHGDYPPSNLAAFGVKSRNATNEGNEALVVAFLHKDYDGATRLEESSLMDLEGDRADKNVTIHPNPLLREIVDSWENPIIYIQRDDYDRDHEYEFVNQETFESEVVRVRAEKDEVTGSYHGKESYQLRSAGPDGVINTEDDIASYERE